MARDRLQEDRQACLLTGEFRAARRAPQPPTNRWNTVTINSAAMIPIGTLRLGFFVSSPPQATVSRPMNEKNTVPAAAVMPTMPAKPLLLSVLINGSKFFASNPENATTTKNARIASLISTMAAFIDADSLVPRASMIPHIHTSRIGGRLNLLPDGSRPVFAGDQHRHAKCVRYLPVKGVLQEIIQVRRPANCGCARRESVLQQQASGHDERREFADRRICKGV